MKKIIIPIILFLFFIILIYTGTRDDTWYRIAKITPKVEFGNSQVIKIGLNDKDIPKKYNAEFMEQLSQSIKEEKEIAIKRYGGGWFSRKKMGVDFYRGAFHYLAITRKTYESKGFQKAMRKYEKKLPMKIVYILKIPDDTGEGTQTILLLRKSSPKEKISV